MNHLLQESGTQLQVSKFMLRSGEPPRDAVGAPAYLLCTT